MSIRLSCACGKGYGLADSMRGKVVRCPACGRKYRVDDPPVLVAGPPAGQVRTRVCSICRCPLAATARTKACDACRQVYHQGCWSEYGGCASYGCAGAPKAAAEVQTSEARQEAREAGRRSQDLVRQHLILILSSLSLVTLGLTGLVGAPMALVEMGRGQPATWVLKTGLALSVAGIVLGISLGVYLSR